MAKFIDLNDDLNEAGDLTITTLMRHKLFNILNHRFAEAPALFLDLSDVVGLDLNPNAVSRILVDHLSNFGASSVTFDVEVERVQGVLTFSAVLDNAPRISTAIVLQEET